MIQFVVFDWNGTLLADVHTMLDTDNYVLELYGGKAVDLKTYRETLDVGNINFYIQNGANEDKIRTNQAEFAAAFHEHYEAHANKCRSRSGARELLQCLKDNSIRILILSNHTVQGINSQLKRLKIDDYVDELIANHAHDAAWQELEKYMQQHKLNPENGIIVGDSPEEVHIGRNLGLQSVSITDGFYATVRLKAVKPNFLINNLKEIIHIVKKGV